MAYELRKIENAEQTCPRCFGRTVKGGKNSQGKPRRVCRECGYQYVQNIKGTSIEEMEAKIQKNEDAIKKLKVLANVTGTSS